MTTSYLGVVEEDEKRPVDEPSLLLKWLKGGSERRLVNEHLQPLEFVQSALPVLGEDLAGQLAPHPVQVVLVSRLNQQPVNVQVLGGILKYEMAH